MGYGEIRTVYAVLPDGSQIVRYDRSKRWFHEDARGKRIKRFRRVTDAATLAANGFYVGGQVFSSQPNGTYFDKYVTGILDNNPVPPIARYTRAGLAQAIKRAQAKYDHELAKWEQANPYWAQYRDRRDYKKWLIENYNLPEFPDVLRKRAS
jgi:hypothetical protein